MLLTLTSSAFQHGQPIPTRHTADGPDLSPPLQWRDPPAGTKSFALICDDLDAPRGTWVHWVVWNVPATARSLPEGVPKQPQLPDGTRQGTNDFGEIGYGGPSPPRGSPHRYFFRLYALDCTLDLKPGAQRADLEKAMTGHVLARGELMGTYQRR
jgi:Raf kinase inhibitor-like YbhB/YbcL family protein